MLKFFFKTLLCFFAPFFLVIKYFYYSKMYFNGITLIKGVTFITSKKHNEFQREFNSSSGYAWLFEKSGVLDNIQYLNCTINDRISIESVNSLRSSYNPVIIIGLGEAINFRTLIQCLIYGSRRIIISSDFVRSFVQLQSAVLTRHKDILITCDADPLKSLPKINNSHGPYLIGNPSVLNSKIVTPFQEKDFTQALFIGNKDKIRIEYLKFLEDSGIPILSLSNTLTNNEYCNYMSRFGIHINFNESKYKYENGIFNPEYNYQIKGRFSESLHFGALHLTNGSDILPTFFENGSDYLSWNNVEELVNLITRIQSLPETFQHIADSGKFKIDNYYTNYLSDSWSKILVY